MLLTELKVTGNILKQLRTELKKQNSTIRSVFPPPTKATLLGSVIMHPLTLTLKVNVLLIIEKLIYN